MITLTIFSNGKPMILKCKTVAIVPKLSVTNESGLKFANPNNTDMNRTAFVNKFTTDPYEKENKT